MLVWVYCDDHIMYRSTKVRFYDVGSCCLVTSASWWMAAAAEWRHHRPGVPAMARCCAGPHTIHCSCNGHHTLAAGQMRIQPAACRSYFCNTVSNTHDNKNYEDNDNPVLQPISKSHDFHCFIPSCPLNFCQTQGQHLLLRYKNLR